MATSRSVVTALENGMPAENSISFPPASRTEKINANVKSSLFIFHPSAVPLANLLEFIHSPAEARRGGKGSSGSRSDSPPRREGAEIRFLCVSAPLR